VCGGVCRMPSHKYKGIWGPSSAASMSGRLLLWMCGRAQAECDVSVVRWTGAVLSQWALLTVRSGEEQEQRRSCFAAWRSRSRVS
jgi:hypothetical protein